MCLLQLSFLWKAQYYYEALHAFVELTQKVIVQRNVSVNYFKILFFNFYIFSVKYSLQIYSEMLQNHCSSLKEMLYYNTQQPTSAVSVTQCIFIAMFCALLLSPYLHAFISRTYHWIFATDHHGLFCFNLSYIFYTGLPQIPRENLGERELNNWWRNWKCMDAKILDMKQFHCDKHEL